jgi:CheY-like chemotaxis protein
LAKILVVEDSKFQSKMIIKALENDHDVTSADHGKHALKTIEKNRPDCILSDLVMPEMDGFEFLSKLKELNYQIPVVMLTSDTQDITKKKCLELGAKTVLKKPFKSDDLLEAIQNNLK